MKTPSLILLLILLACTNYNTPQSNAADTAPSQIAPQSQALTSVDPADLGSLVRSNNEFAFDLYAQLREKPGNIVLSPCSIFTALTMTYAGAREDTANEIAAVLHLNLRNERLHSACAALTKTEKAADGQQSKLHIANAIWAQRGLPVLPAFVDCISRFYRGAFIELDFAHDPESSRQSINHWIEDQTENRIKELLKPKPVDETTRMVLTNAVYLKSPWQLPFSPSLTKECPFQLNTKDQIKVPMMKHGEVFRFFEDNDVQLLELPFRGRKKSLVLALPRKTDGLTEMERSLTMAQLDTWLANCTFHDVNSEMPKIRVTSEFSLQSSFRKLGMSRVFGAKADFSGIFPSEATVSRLRISDIIHQASLDADEKGVEAAAATATVFFDPISLRVATFPVAKIHVNHPFIFFIRDLHNGHLLFVGRVLDPR